MREGNALQVFYDEKLVGTLAMTADHKAAFQYSEEWIENGFPISPFSLPLKKQVFVPTKDYFDGLFGVFADSLPDNWGRLLLDRLLRAHKQNPDKLTVLDRLAIVGKSGMGALTYYPEKKIDEQYGDVDLDELAEQCRKILNTEYSDRLDELYRLGGTSGGARPKIMTTVNPANLALVDFKVLRSSQQNTQNPKITDYAVRPEESQKITETVSSASNDMKNLTEIPEQKRTVRYESDKWLGIVAVIFVAVWLSVAVLKLTGELLAYYFSIRNLERMSLQVSDTVSIQMYRAACQKKHVRRIPELRQNAGLTTPLLAGLLHTKLYLPATGYSAEERKLIFYHELTHYCHRDLWYKMLLRICASIYWFNPFLLIMLKEADKDIENLCDTAVVRRVNKKEHKLYRQLLLRTVAMENQIPYVTASLNDSEMVFKDRILYMVNIRKLRKGILPGILVTLLLAGGNLVFNVSAGTDTVSVETEK